MLFKEIIEGRYKVFSRMKDEEKSRNIGVVKYVETLASLAGVNISNWDCMAIFGNGDKGNKLIDGKNEINRLFFNEVERLATESPVPEGELISEEQKQQIRAAEARHITTLIATEQRYADEQLRAATTRYKDYETYMKRAGEHLATVRRLSGQSSNVEEQIRQVVGGSFWQFIGVERGTKVVFVTKGDVHISHRNEAAGININLNFGRFKAVFDIADFAMRVFTHERNIVSHGYYHPHISGGSGGICWGTAASTAQRHLSACQFAEPLTLLATILSNYNPASPYHALERFQEAYGTPEEHERRDAIIETRDQVRATMASLDQMVLAVDAPQAPTQPVEVPVLAEVIAPAEAVTLENQPPENTITGILFVPDEESAEVEAPRRRNRARAPRSTSNTITITTTSNNDF